jgi:fumarate hydratase class II
VHCARGIEPDRARIAELLERSLMLVTALVPHIGHDAAAWIAHAAQRDRTSLRDAALAAGGIRDEEFDRWVRPAAMTGTADGATGEPGPAAPAPVAGNGRRAAPV